MAGDCPHHFQFQSTLQQCHEQTALIAATHDNYLQFIDELKTDLDDLSCQVELVQQQFVNDAEESTSKDKLLHESPANYCLVDGAGDADVMFVGTEIQSSQSELETQNELLQETLNRMEQQNSESNTTLKQNNDGFKCQIEQLQCTIYEKENRIKQLNSMLTRLSHIRLEAPSSQTTQQQLSDLQTKQQCELQVLREQIEQLKCKNKALCEELEKSQKQERFLHSETRKLNDELMETKRRNNELNMQTRRLASLLKSQECDRMEVTQKYEMIERTYEDQAKKLRAANIQINQLQERFCIMEKRNDEHNMERNLLREEVLALKEKEAIMLGKQRSLQDQLMKLEKEIYTAHEVIKEQQCILQRNEVAHEEVVKRLQEQGNETKRHFNMVVEDYNCLQEEYEKQNELRRQNEKVIESFRKWKEAQLQSDEATRASFKQYEEHIRLLLEEKQKFLEKYRELNRDFCVMQGEVDRLRSYSATALINNSENSIAQRMELIRRTSRRVSIQSSSLQTHADSQDLHLSRSRSAQNICY